MRLRLPSSSKRMLPMDRFDTSTWVAEAAPAVVLVAVLQVTLARLGLRVVALRVAVLRVAVLPVAQSRVALRARRARVDNNPVRAQREGPARQTVADSRR